MDDSWIEIYNLALYTLYTLYTELSFTIYAYSDDLTVTWWLSVSLQSG